MFQNLFSAKMMLTHSFRHGQVDDVFLNRKMENVTLDRNPHALLPSGKINYETATQKKNQLLDAIALRGQATHYLLRFAGQPDSNNTQTVEEIWLTQSNFSAMTPRLIQITQCSNPDAWYAQLLYEEFTVIEKCNDFYVVDTWNGYGQIVPEFIKISDTKILER